MRIANALAGIALAITLAPMPASAQEAGVTAAVNQSARGTPPGSSMRTISLGDNIVQNERIETDTGGLVQILLADGTTFTVGPNSSLTIDSFVYDPDAGTADLAATMGRGVMRFVGGRASKGEAGVRVNTPVGTIGIRGGIADINLDPGTPELVAYFNLLFGDELVLTRYGQPIRVYQEGYSLVIGASGETTIVKTPPEFLGALQQLLAGGPGTSGGSSNIPTEETVLGSGLPDINSWLPPGTHVSPKAPPWGPRQPDKSQTTEMDSTSDFIHEEFDDWQPPMVDCESDPMNPMC